MTRFASTDHAAVPAPMRTLSLSEAAAFLRMHPEEVRRRAKCGAIPGAKPGRCWIFIEGDLAEYVRSFYATPRQALQVTLRKEMQCHFANADEKLARGCSNATVNRTLALVRAILRQCVNEWEWLERAPQVRMFREPTRRIRSLTHEEAGRLHGGILARDGPAGSECHRSAVAASGFDASVGVRASGSGEGAQGDRRAAQRRSDGALAQAGREASDVRVQLQGRADYPSQVPRLGMRR